MRRFLCILLPWLLAAAAGPAAAQQQPIELTLEKMVELGLRDSYRVRELLLDIDRTRAQLQAERAGLKSRIDLSLAAPELQAISDYKWNSTLQRNELVHENTRRWEADLSISQPVILFGYPTNGTLSLNNRIYRYTQLDDGERDSNFYNRYFVRYEQPLFQPNRMKNDLERAELELESSELNFQGDIVEVLDELAGDYYELLEAAYERTVAAQRIEDLERAVNAAEAVVAADSTRDIELDQLAVSLANARESQLSAASDYRLRTAELKQRLRLAATDSIVVHPVLEVTPIDVDAERAIALALSLAPRIREIEINRRESELRLDETRGNGSFRIDLELTYGREVEDPHFENLWTRPRNSYTINVDAYLPIWDWGERGYRIRAQEISLERNQLSMEQARSEIESNVRNELLNLEEYEQRALNMQNNLERAQQLTDATLENYRAGRVTLVDVLQTIERESDTARNLMEAYLGYQNALLDLKRMTYYDFEHQMPLLERFRIGALAESDLLP